MPRDFRKDANLYAAIGQRIRAQRKGQRLAGRIVASECGMTDTQLYRIERGRRGLSVAALIRIAAALAVSSSELLPRGPANG